MNTKSRADKEYPVQDDILETENQETFELKSTMEPERVFELAQTHFPEESGLKEVNRSETCISFDKPSRPWTGSRVSISACKKEESTETVVTVEHIHRGHRVRKFIEELV